MSSVKVNANGGFYMPGLRFDEAKYASLIPTELAFNTDKSHKSKEVSSTSQNNG